MKFSSIIGDSKAWEGDLATEKGEMFAHVCYDGQAPLSVMTIHFRENKLVIKSSNGNFKYGGGGISLNQKLIASFVTNSGNSTIKIIGVKGNIMMRVFMDSSYRRYKWACRHGLSRSQARQYTFLSDIIIAKNFALASIINASLPWKDGDNRVSIFSQFDEEVFHSLKDEEQGIILFLAMRYLCGHGLLGAGSWGLCEHTCPDIPSFHLIQKQDNNQYLTVDYRALKNRNDFKGNIVEIFNLTPVAVTLALIFFSLILIYPSHPVAPMLFILLGIVLLYIFLVNRSKPSFAQTWRIFQKTK